MAAPNPATALVVKIVPKIIPKSIKMNPRSTKNHEKWVLGVTWELPGGTLGPKRGQSEKKGGNWDFLPPPLGLILKRF